VSRKFIHSNTSMRSCKC